MKLAVLSQVGAGGAPRLTCIMVLVWGWLSVAPSGPHPAAEPPPPVEDYLVSLLRHTQHLLKLHEAKQTFHQNKGATI